MSRDSPVQIWCTMVEATTNCIKLDLLPAVPQHLDSVSQDKDEDGWKGASS